MAFKESSFDTFNPHVTPSLFHLPVYILCRSFLTKRRLLCPHQKGISLNRCNKSCLAVTFKENGERLIMMQNIWVDLPLYQIMLLLPTGILTDDILAHRGSSHTFLYLYSLNVSGQQKSLL